MTSHEFVDLYKGRRVRVKMGLDHGVSGVVSHSGGQYVWITLDEEYVGDRQFWEHYRPDELELIDLPDNSPLPLPG